MNFSNGPEFLYEDNITQLSTPMAPTEGGEKLLELNRGLIVAEIIEDNITFERKE